jgi:hypothetical protein
LVGQPVLHDIIMNQTVRGCQRMLAAGRRWESGWAAGGLRNRPLLWSGGILRLSQCYPATLHNCETSVK